MKLTAVLFSVAALFVPAIASADPMNHVQRHETRQEVRHEIRHEREAMRDRVRNAERAFHREVREIRHDWRGARR